MTAPALQAGDELATFGRTVRDRDIWHPHRFLSIDAENRMHLGAVYPWQLDQCRWIHRYGDPTGAPADIDVTFWRLAAEVAFLRFCPACQARGCEACDDGYVKVDPFRDVVPRVFHFETGKEMRPGVVSRRPEREPGFIFGEFTFTRDVELRVTFQSMPDSEYAKLPEEAEDKAA